MNETSAYDVVKRINDAFAGKPAEIPSTREISEAARILARVTGTGAPVLPTQAGGITEVNRKIAENLAAIAQHAQDIRERERLARDLRAALPPNIADALPAVVRPRL